MTQDENQFGLRQMQEMPIREACRSRLEQVFNRPVRAYEIDDEWSFVVDGEPSIFGFWPIDEMPSDEDEAFFRKVMETLDELHRCALAFLRGQSRLNVADALQCVIFRKEMALELKMELRAKKCPNAFAIVVFEEGAPSAFEIVESPEDEEWWDSKAGFWQP